MTDIQNFAAADLARRTGDVLDAASRAPVAITKHRKPRFVIMSMERFEAITGETTQTAFGIDDMPENIRMNMIEALERDLYDGSARDD